MVEIMDIFELTCGGMQICPQPLRVLLSEDPLPLVQNCCFVELALGQITIALDDGCRILRLRNGLEAAFLDRHNGLLTLWLTPDAQRESGVGVVQIRLQPQQVGGLGRWFMGLWRDRDARRDRGSLKIGKCHF